MEIRDTLSKTQCANCNIPFAIPQTFIDAKVNGHPKGHHGRTFYCPNGHEISFSAEGNLDQYFDKVAALEKELAREKARADKNYELWAQAQAKAYPQTQAMLREVKGG